MKILSIGSDRNLFKEGSGVRARIVEYGTLVDELHVIVFSKRSLTLSKQKISDNVWLYPINSLSRWFYIFGAIRIGKKIISKSSDWLVTSQDSFESGFVAWRIAKKRKAKLQLQVHTDFLSPYFLESSSLNKIRVKIAKFLLPKADCVRVVSKRIADSLRDADCKLKVQPQILPIFVDMQAIRNAPIDTNIRKLYPQFDTIILMVSRLEKEKNILLALSVFKKVVDSHPKTGLVIIGEGSQLSMLKKYARKHSLKDNVVFEGDSSDVLSFFKTADIFLHTSNYEGYGMVLIEAAASDCLIVTTDVGIASEYFKETQSAHICDILDKDCLASCLIKIIKNKELKNMTVLKAQGAIECHTKEKTKEQYMARYKELWEECFK